MKKVITLLLLGIISYSIQAQVGIGTTSPDSSAVLEVKSFDRGFLPPRMTEEEMNAILPLTAGLFVYCSDCCEGELFFCNGDEWESLGDCEQPLYISASPTLISGLETASGAEDNFNVGISPNFIPEARSYSRIVSNLGDYLYLFGGGDKEIHNNVGSELSNELNTLWQYQISTNTWSVLSAQVPLTGAGLEAENQLGDYVNADLNLRFPRSRARFGMTYDKARNAIWIFGGFSENDGLNDLWKYELDANRWVLIDGTDGQNIDASFSGTIRPGSVYGHDIVIDVKGDVWMFGGDMQIGGSVGLSQDVWKFTVNGSGDGGSWAHIKGSQLINQGGVPGSQGESAPANIPGGRKYFAMDIASNNTIWIMGGRARSVGNVEGNLGDLWKYNLTTSEWTFVAGATLNNTDATFIDNFNKGDITSMHIGSRKHFDLTIDESGTLWLYGGMLNANSRKGKDLWKFDNNTSVFTLISGKVAGTVNSGEPDLHWGHSITNTQNATLYMFGGTNMNLETDNLVNDLGNDLWKFNLSID